MDLKKVTIEKIEEKQYSDIIKNVPKVMEVINPQTKKTNTYIKESKSNSLTYFTFRNNAVKLLEEKYNERLNCIKFFLNKSFINLKK